MKLTTISTALFLYYTTCLATDDIVNLLYNDGISYNEIEIPLRPAQDGRDRPIREGSSNILATDIYAARILSGPDDVQCYYEAVSKRPSSGKEKDGGEVRLRRVGGIIHKLNTIINYTSPPQEVVRITCFIRDYDTKEEDEERRRALERMWGEYSFGPLRPARIMIDLESLLPSQRDVPEESGDNYDEDGNEERIREIFSMWEYIESLLPSQRDVPEESGDNDDEDGNEDAIEDVDNS